MIVGARSFDHLRTNSRNLKGGGKALLHPSRSTAGSLTQSPAQSKQRSSDQPRSAWWAPASNFRQLCLMSADLGSCCSVQYRHANRSVWKAIAISPAAYQIPLFLQGSAGKANEFHPECGTGLSTGGKGKVMQQESNAAEACATVE
jgi:hypothetical protein